MKLGKNHDLLTSRYIHMKFLRFLSERRVLQVVPNTPVNTSCMGQPMLPPELLLSRAAARLFCVQKVRRRWCPPTHIVLAPVTCNCVLRMDQRDDVSDSLKAGANSCRMLEETDRSSVTSGPAMAFSINDVLRCSFRATNVRIPCQQSTHPLPCLLYHDHIPLLSSPS